MQYVRWFFFYYGYYWPKCSHWKAGSSFLLLFWVSWLEGYKEKAGVKRLRCNVPVHPGETSEVHADTVNTFWKDIQVAHVYSPNIDYVRDINGTTGVIVCLESALVDDGHYILESGSYVRHIRFTSSFRPCNALQAFCAYRLLTPNIVNRRIHAELSSCIQSLLAQARRQQLRHWRGYDDYGLALQKSFPPNPSRNDIKEAVNHILVSGSAPRDGQEFSRPTSGSS